jgi:RNA polymerase sigma factor (sigma-70 family)
VEQLRRGNDVAFEVLYDRYSAGVLSYCRHMLGSLDQAEDALQHSFISAHADLTASDKPIRFKPWIYTIARNRCLTIIRARREQPSDELDNISTAGLSEEVQHRADLRQLVHDLQELPDDQRAALVLSELGDLSHADVAEIIGCEGSKVKSLVFQARSGLIERRQARETPCSEIREQLATLTGGSLRRGPLRRHLKACPGCAEFREDVKRQRAMLAIALPVIPSLGLRESALAAVGGAATSVGGGAATAGGGLGAMAVAKVGSVGAAKIAAVALAVGGAAVGGPAAVERVTADKGAPAPAGQSESSSSTGSAAGTDAPEGSAAAALEEATRRGRGNEVAGNKSKGEERGNGFNPEQGGSNGDAARDFAAGRGKSGDRGRSESAPGQNREPGSNGKALANGKSGGGKANGKANGNANGRAKPERPVKAEKPKPVRPERPVKPAPVKPKPKPEPRSTTPAPAEPAPAPESEPVLPLPNLGGKGGKGKSDAAG